MNHHPSRLIQANHWLQAQLVARKPVVCCLLFAVSAMPIVGLFMLLQTYALASPSTRALYHPGALWAAQGMLVALILGLGLVALHGWRSRQAELPCRRLSTYTVTATVVALVLLGLGYGLKDTPMSLTILAALFLGRALFGLQAVLPGLVASVLLVLLSEALVALDVLPYAPLLVQPVMSRSQLEGWWGVWVRLVFTCSALPFSGMMFFLFGSLAKRRRELEELVRTDMLTGLANRRTFMDQLEIESHRHARNKRPFCLVMCDIDHFKRINDTWGHPAGDAVLVELGRILKRTTRAQLDTAARIGGEEFAVLLPETNLIQAQAMAETMSAGVRSHIFVFDGDQVSVTQSVGVAQTANGNGQAAWRLADDNLYQAKRSGRDRIVASHVETETPV